MKITGTGVAIVTPFDKKGNVDFKGLENLINHCIKGKVDYLVVMGTTGESVVLSKSEKKQVVDFVIAKAYKKVGIVLGIGGNNTQEVVASFNDYNFKNIDAILSVTPYYNKPTQKGLVAHYHAVANVSPVPVILYNVPGRTSVNMLPETTLELAQHKNIIAIKEASGSIEQMMKIINHKPEKFMVISGDDALTLPLIVVGGVGVISVVAQAYPKEYAQMVKLALKGKFEDAKKLHYKLLDITECLFKEGNPAGIKELLQHMKICENNLRLPLVKVSNELSDKIKKMMW